MNKLSITYFLVVLFIILLLIVSCGGEPEPINYGHDECEYCKMLITDNKYGAELITEKGKIYKYDSIECLVNYALVENLIGNNKVTMLVDDFSNLGKFTDARTAFYLHNDEFRSPMGLNVMAFSAEEKRSNFRLENGGNKLSWIDVIELTKQKDN
jgi:copper chaperone NosL